jgi:hypothetical protein
LFKVLLQEISFDDALQHLCIETNPDGSVTLSVREHEILAELSDYIDDDGNEQVPDEIGGAKVSGFDSEFVYGTNLVVRQKRDEPEITIDPGDVAGARQWLEDYGWTHADGYAEALAEIEATLRGR